MSIFYDPADFISELPPFGKPLMSTLLPEDIIAKRKEFNIETVEDKILTKVAYIGEKIPETLANDIRPKFVLLGTPKELIDDIKGELM